jgi:hypothetical protein
MAWYWEVEFKQLLEGTWRGYEPSREKAEQRVRGIIEAVRAVYPGLREQPRVMIMEEVMRRDQYRET